MADTATHDKVKEYYGKMVKSTDDLKTDVCMVDKNAYPVQAKEAFKLIHPDVLSKNYGCGAVFPEAVEGCSVLDLGSGAGLDCFVLSKLVGPNGHVTGVDMTPEQLEVARSHIDYHTEKFGYSKPNVEFREGYIEQLDKAGLQDNSFDIIISNCVVNLTPDKSPVLQEAFRVLKPGGEMYFSDIYSNMAIPEQLRKSVVFWGECLAGALQWRELMQIATDVGFAPPVLVKSSIITCEEPEMKKMAESAGGLQFCSATYRLMKVKWDKDTSAEDPLMEVKYKGTINGYEKGVQFSHHGTIPSSCLVAMPASTTQLLLQSRFAPHFSIQPLPAGGDATPVCPTIRDFLEVDPFEVSSSKIAVEGSSLIAKGSCCSSSGGMSCCL